MRVGYVFWFLLWSSFLVADSHQPERHPPWRLPLSSTGIPCLSTLTCGHADGYFIINLILRSYLLLFLLQMKWALLAEASPFTWVSSFASPSWAPLTLSKFYLAPPGGLWTAQARRNKGRQCHADGSWDYLKKSEAGAFPPQTHQGALSEGRQVLIWGSKGRLGWGKRRHQFCVRSLPGLPHKGLTQSKCGDGGGWWGGEVTAVEQNN